MFFEDFLMPIGVLFVIFYFTYQIIKVLAHRKERQMMVEKMSQNPDIMNYRLENQMEIVKSPYNWLKPAGLVIGLGIGCILAFFFLKGPGAAMMSEGMVSMMVLGMSLICGGLGMLGGFFTERALRNTDAKKK